MSAKSDAGMPRLDVFDQEFGPDPTAILREPRRRARFWSWTVVGLVLIGGIISAVAFTWPLADVGQAPELRSASLTPQATSGEGGADEQIRRLLREMAVLKNQIRELTTQQRQADDTIAALRAAVVDPQGASVPAFWYSDVTALNFGVASVQEPSAAAEPATRRPRTRASEPRRRERENSGPISLDPSQN
jgi:hypothetical protein